MLLVYSFEFEQEIEIYKYGASAWPRAIIALMVTAAVGQLVWQWRTGDGEGQGMLGAAADEGAESAAREAGHTSVRFHAHTALLHRSLRRRHHRHSLQHPRGARERPHRVRRLPHDPEGTGGQGGGSGGDVCDRPIALVLLIAGLLTVAGSIYRSLIKRETLSGPS